VTIEKDFLMKTEDSKAVEVCKKMLDLLENEKSEIKEKNLDSIEHYCSLKMDLIKELDEINKEAARQTIPGREAKVEPLLKKIMELNEANAEAVRDMKKNVVSDISSSHKKKSVFKAYNP
jgi:hypothetical protein